MGTLSIDTKQAEVTASVANEKENMVKDAAVSVDESVEVATENNVEVSSEGDAGAIGEEVDNQSTEEIATEGVTEGVTEGEDINLDTSVEELPADMGMEEGLMGDPGFNEEMYKETFMETGMAEVKDPIMSSWPFVIGISVAVLLVSVAFGALLARRKIKKGIELYED